jgi:di/tricarboxylate transporter
MNPDLLWVLALLAGAVTLFVIGKPRMDVVALLVLVALPLSGVLDLQQSLAGFSDANVILIAALFVIGDGLVRTGIAYRLGDWLVARAGSSETRLLILLMLTVAGLGSVMSSTGVVAIFIPVVLGVAARLRIAPARLMMPLAFAGRSAACSPWWPPRPTWWCTPNCAAPAWTVSPSSTSPPSAWPCCCSASAICCWRGAGWCAARPARAMSRHA